MRPAIERYPDGDGAAGACAAAILGWLKTAVQARGRASLAVSGGSTPKLMFDHMAKADFDWTNVHIFWVDERPVPPSDPQSNYRLAREHLLEPAHLPEQNLHRILAEGESKSAAARYSEEIKLFFHLGPGQLPQFDVIHLGIGPDAHTASLFPGQPLVHDREGIAAAVFVDKISQWRISLLPGVLLAAEHLAVLAAGADKAEALQNIFESPRDPLVTPAQLLLTAKNKAFWFVDGAAASYLKF